MNLLPKSLIIFLFVWVTGAISLVIAGTPASASEIVTKRHSYLPKKHSAVMRTIAFSAAAMPVQLTWQTIRSLGQGAKMSWEPR